MYDVCDMPESPDVEFTTAWTTKPRQNPSSSGLPPSAGSGSVGSISSAASNDKVLHLRFITYMEFVDLPLVFLV